VIELEGVYRPDGQMVQIADLALFDSMPEVPS